MTEKVLMKNLFLYMLVTTLAAIMSDLALIYSGIPKDAASLLVAVIILFIAAACYGWPVLAMQHPVSMIAVFSAIGGLLAIALIENFGIYITVIGCLFILGILAWIAFVTVGLHPTLPRLRCVILRMYASAGAIVIAVENLPRLWS